MLNSDGEGAGEEKDAENSEGEEAEEEEEEVEEEEEEEELQDDEQIEMEEVPRAGTVKTKPMKDLQCGCAPICSALLPRIPKAGDRLSDEEGLELLEWSHDLH